LSTPEEFHGTTRRRFAARLGGALFGFASVGKALMSADPAGAAYVSCHKGNVYCTLDRVEEGCPTMCVYHCYDSRTLKFCWSFKDPC
jgi:outer membrane protein assembly factor BamB